MDGKIRDAGVACQVGKCCQEFDSGLAARHIIDRAGGACFRNRTEDLFITSEVLCQLS